MVTNWRCFLEVSDVKGYEILPGTQVYTVSLFFLYVNIFRTSPLSLLCDGY